MADGTSRRLEDLHAQPFGEIFETLLEAKVLVERWRWEHNRFRPHGSLGYRPPAPEAVPAPLPRKAG